MDKVGAQFGSGASEARLEEGEVAQLRTEVLAALSTAGIQVTSGINLAERESFDLEIFDVLDGGRQLGTLMPNIKSGGYKFFPKLGLS